LPTDHKVWSAVSLSLETVVTGSLILRTAFQMIKHLI